MGSLSARLLRLLSVPDSPLGTTGKLDRLPSPGLRVIEARAMEVRFSPSAAGVGVGVGESSGAVGAAMGGGVEVPEEGVSLAVAEAEESLDVPLGVASVAAASVAALMLTLDSCS